VKTALRRARDLAGLALDLYREMAFSALRLLPGRDLG
jgi:hypothetical protein